MKPAAWALLWAAVVGVLTPSAPATADPMRPLLAAPLEAGAAAAPAADGSAAPVTAAAAQAGLRRLLAIRQDTNGERKALFGDRWLRVGDRYTAPEGETVVRAIGAHHLELAQGKLTHTHHLLAPLLPPQWPVLATAAVANGPGHKAAAPKTPTAPRPVTTPAPTAAPPSATAYRTERQ